jgi:hypothetical protein
MKSSKGTKCRNSHFCAVVVWKFVARSERFQLTQHGFQLSAFSHRKALINGSMRRRGKGTASAAQEGHESQLCESWERSADR